MINDLKNDINLKDFQKLFSPDEIEYKIDLYSILLKEIMLRGYCEN